VAGAWVGYGACPDLQVKLGLSQGTSKTTYQVIVFTNRGTHNCFLNGSPGVNLGGGTPVAPIGLPAQANSPKSIRITVPPGKMANALLQITNASTYTAAKCGPVQAQYLIVYLANDTPPVKLPYGTTACSRAVKMLQISAVAFGAGSD